MLQSLAVHKTVKGVYDILSKDGVIILPSKLGYGILAITTKGVERLYALKERPHNKLQFLVPIKQAQEIAMN